jgi:small-conductance mechanosensitive channel
MTETTTPGFADRLSSDVVSLIHTLRSPWTWIVMLALVAFVVSAARIRVNVSQDRRFTPRVRAVLSASINALAILVAAVVLASFFWKRAPLLLGISLAVLAAAAGLGIAIRGRAWIWGLVIIWRGRIRIGDRLRVGTFEGSVTDAGIFGITILVDDGARVFVPSAKLSMETFSVASPEEVHPAEIIVRRADRELTDPDLEALRRIGALCPYRQSGGIVTVAASADRRTAIVGFRAWSEEAASLAREHVQQAFAASTAPADVADPVT